MALMMALFALLLLSCIGLCMVLASTTETRIDANYGGSLRSYYAAHSGLEEVRDRMSYPSTSLTLKNGLADQLPQSIAGNAGGVLYVLNPDSGETVDHTDRASPYFDNQLCHDYNSGVTIRDSRCTAVPATANWMTSQNAAPSTTAIPLGYKWVRVNMKTNRIAAPYFVDQTGDPATLDTRVCWDGKTEQLSPGGAGQPCDANGMLPVYMLTSLAMTQGTRNLLRAEVVGSSIRPPGAITMEVGGSTSTNPIPASFDVPTSSNLALIPLTSIDGRVHNADGSLATTLSCSHVAPLAANTLQGTASLEVGLNNLRRDLVNAANNSCNADGTPKSASNPCTPPLAWVRGTGALPRFTTSSPSPTPTPIPVPTPTPMPSPTPSPTPTGSHDGHGNDHSPPPTPTPTPIPTPTPTPTPTPISTGDCSTSTQSCFTNLDLSDGHLSPASLFAGNPGNSGDPAVYQSQTPNIVANANQAVLDYIAARKASNTNYYELASTSLNPAQTYGSVSQPDQPVVLVITDSSLKMLTTSLSGFGILQVPNDFEIQNSNLQWTGIVMVRPAAGASSGQFLINSGATGSINGALMLQAGSQFVLTTSSTGSGKFTVSYSCDAIDLAMGNRPLKVVSRTETSY